MFSATPKVAGPCASMLQGRIDFSGCVMASVQVFLLVLAGSVAALARIARHPQRVTPVPAESA